MNDQILEEIISHTIYLIEMQEVKDLRSEDYRKYRQEVIEVAVSNIKRGLDKENK